MLNNLLIRFLFFSLLFMLSSQVWATTISNSGAGTHISSAFNLGQSFMATQTGVITSIGVAADTAASYTLSIYAGAGIGGFLLHTQSVSFTDTVSTFSSYSFFTIILDGRVNIASGSTYTFAFSSANVPLVYGGDDYANGVLYVNANTNNSFDFKFEIVQGPQNTAPVTTLPAAPTVSENDLNVAIADTINIADGQSDYQTVTLTITGGTVSITTAGLNVTTGDGTDDSSMVFGGTLANVNTALDSMTFTPTAGLNGVNAATIQIQTNDGQSGSDDDSLTFDIAPGP